MRLRVEDDRERERLSGAGDPRGDGFADLLDAAREISGAFHNQKCPSDLQIAWAHSGLCIRLIGQT